MGITSKTVLVVDDFSNAADATCRMLRLSGYDAVSCSEPTECVEMARQIQPAVILLDLAMPDLTGFELIGPLRAAIAKPCKIIAYSGHADPATRQQCDDAGFDAFIAKPACAANLEAALGPP